VQVSDLFSRHSFPPPNTSLASPPAHFTLEHPILRNRGNDPAPEAGLASDRRPRY
jgi:hypothetical protein